MSGSLSFTVRLTGVTFMDGYPDSLHRLAEPAAQAHSSGEPIAAILRRQPDNPTDPNAVQVHVPALGGMVGWLPRSIAAQVAPRIDSGERWAASVRGVAINDDHPERPGLQIDLTYTHDKDRAA